MQNYIKSYYAVKHRLDENRQIFQSINAYLVPGDYKSNATGNIMFRLGSLNHKNLITFNEAEAKNPFVRLLTQKFMLVRPKDDYVFPGEYVIISSSRKEYKIFSKNEIMTIYSDNSKLLMIMDARQHFEGFFCLPKVMDVQIETGICREELIEHEEYSVETAVNIFKNYERFYQSEKILPPLDWKEIIKKVQNRIHISPDLDLLLTLPQTYCHGDLWSSNIIFNGENFFITDFENSGYNYFMYDFFTFIFTEELVLNNDNLMQMYFYGKFDPLLHRLFEALSICYNEKKKRTYFLGYFIIAYSRKWMNAKSLVLKKRIKAIIRKYKLGEVE